MSISASWGAPGPLWGPESKAYTDYECLPPVPVKEFDSHLRAGSLETTIPWSILSNLKPDSSSRLVFEQSVGFEFMGGTFISVQDDNEMEELEADPLTGTRSTLNLLKLTPRRGPQELTPFIQNLVALSENHHLYRIQHRDFESIDSRIFGSLIRPGALIFTHATGGFVLSPDRQNISICVEVDRYEDASQRQDWLVLEPGQFDGQSISRIAFHFAHDPNVAAILKCDELLVGRGLR